MRFTPSLKLASLALAIMGFASAPTSFAATASGSMTVTANVLSSCVVSSTPLNFGNYAMGTVDSNAFITVTCTPDISSYNVALDSGTGSGATTSARKLTTSTGSTLNYTLYRNSGRSLNWGNVSGTDTVTEAFGAVVSAAAKSFTVYGRIPADQIPGVGVYGDTVQVTVNY